MENSAIKTILITGATDGLGKVLATHFAEKGMQVLLHGRNKDKGQALLNNLSKRTKNTNILYYNTDFSSLKSVALMCDEITAKHKHIDILINNAGLYSNTRKTGSDGYELTMTVNYLSQVLLTKKLLRQIPRNGKIINVASASQAPIDFADFMMKKHYEVYTAYCKSKTALLMFTMDLSEQLQPNKISVNALHPATLMNTNMVAKGAAVSSVEDGARTVEALIEISETGRYYNGRTLSRAIPQVYNIESRKQLSAFTASILKAYL